MKNKKIFFKIICMFLFFTFIVSCSNENEIIDMNFEDSLSSYNIDEFKISDITMNVKYKDGKTNKISLTEDMISESDLSKLHNVGSHEIIVNYNNVKETIIVNLKKYYEVKYVIDDEIVSTQLIEHGKDSENPIDVVKDGYRFLGWSSDGKNITEDTIIVGEYSYEECKVTFMIDGEVVDIQNVEYGKDAEMVIPEKEGYSFLGWDSDGKNITEDKTITGEYEINTYSVSFILNGELVDTQIVKHGDAAVEPIVQEGYVVSWEQDFSKITSDLEIVGVSTLKKCKINLTILNASHSIDEKVVEYDYGYKFTEKDINDLDALFGIHMKSYSFEEKDNFLNNVLKEDHNLCIVSKYHDKGAEFQKLDINTFRIDYSINFDVCVAYNDLASSDEIINSGILGTKTEEFKNMFKSYFNNEKIDLFNVYMISDLDSNNNLVNDRILIQLSFDYSKYLIIDSEKIETNNEFITRLGEEYNIHVFSGFLNAIEENRLSSAGIKFEFVDGKIEYELKYECIDYKIN